MMMLRAAVLWHVFALSRSAFHLGLIGLVQFIPALFLNLIGVQTTSQCPLPANPQLPLDRRVIPFDYVSRVTLTGQPGNRLEDEVAVNVEGGFYVSAIGYGLQTDSPLQSAGS